MRRTLQIQRITLVVTLLALTACGDSSLEVSSATSGTAQAAEVTTEKRLAVSHFFSLRLPSKEVEAVQQRHLAECAKLGCSVLKTTLDRWKQGEVKASISTRIAPEAFSIFVTTITALPAEVASHTESAEDKALPLLDVGKRLEVKTALRDRLNAMLREPGTKSVADLVAIEKELAQVQADIEAAITQRDHLQKITETVKVDVTYTGIAAQTGGFDLSPIDRAIRGVGLVTVNSIAALISFTALIIPWLPLVALVMWGFRRQLRGWRARKGAG